MRQHIKHYSITVVIVLAILVTGAGVFIYSGLYNLGADAHHSQPVLALMQILRDRSVHVHSKDIKVPDLEDPEQILKGAGHYAAMCTGCHLAPGMKDSEIRPGLYPEPPNLSQVRIDPQDAFWVIKHGIKMSAMPAWGLSHDDPTIWSMVAFLRKLPDMTRAQYKDIVAKAPPDEDMDMDERAEHVHDSGEPDTHDTAKRTDASEETRGEGSSQGAAGDKHHPH
jgi:mono/diheme cytochrome c family protein